MRLSILASLFHHVRRSVQRRRRVAGRNRPAPRRSATLAVQPLEDRRLMAAVQWEPRIVNGQMKTKPSLTATVEFGNLKLVGTSRPDGVTIRHTKGDGKPHGGVMLENGVDYLEIWHSDGIPGQQRWRGWIKNSEVNDFVFLGNAGNDTFQYVDWSGDGLGAGKDSRSPLRRVVAFGGPGDDKLYGFEANDILMGEDGIDRLVGGLGCDLLDGGRHNDILIGDGSKRARPSTDPNVDADYLIGGLGADDLFGEQGRDLLVGGEYLKVNDLTYDALYGGQDGPDWFFIEFRQEAKDYQPALPYSKFADGDHLIGAGDQVRPPSHLDWILKLENSLHVGGPLNTSRLPILRQLVLNQVTNGKKDYPNLRPGNFEVVLPGDEVYQCTGASVGRYGPFSPGSDPLKWTPQWFDSQYRVLYKRDVNANVNNLSADTAKVERVVLYRVRDNRVPGGWRITHAARQLADGTWLSKLDNGPLIRHRSLNDLSSSPNNATPKQYGVPYYVYTRPRLGSVDCGCA